jgi:hypothetical protein
LESGCKLSPDSLSDLRSDRRITIRTDG